MTLASCQRAPLAVGAPANAKLVRVKARCNDNGKVSFSIDKFAVEIRPKQNQSVWWLPDNDGGNNNDVTVTIEPKPGSPWPFGGRSFELPPGSGVGSGPVQNPPSDSFTVQYNLVFTCTIDGASRTVTIDPDIIIVDAM